LGVGVQDCKTYADKIRPASLPEERRKTITDNQESAVWRDVHHSRGQKKLTDINRGESSSAGGDDRLIDIKKRLKEIKKIVG